MDVSVLLPVRDWDLNRVELCVRSVKDSIGVNAEVVLVDWGSEDQAGLEAVAAKYDLVVKRVEASEWSRSRAMNEAFRHSSCDIVVFGDADLIFARSTLAAVVAELKRDPFQVILLQARDLPPFFSPEGLLNGQIDPFLLDSESAWRPRWGMGIEAHTRKTFQLLRGFDERMSLYGGEDNDIAKRARMNGLRLTWMSSVDNAIFHVWHPSSREVVESDSKTKQVLSANRDIVINDNSRVRNISSTLSGDPLVSVVISTHNRAEFLPESIESVLSQTCQDFELLIMDDGSTDNTTEVVASFNDERIRYFRNEPKGLAWQRNLACRLSKGRYTAVHDDDDIMLPWSLEARLNGLTAGVVGSYGAYYDFDDKTGDLSLFPGRECSLTNLINHGRVLAHGTLLVDTRVIRAIGYDDVFKAGSDYNMIVRILRSGYVLKHCNDVVLLRRRHGKQVTSECQGIQHGASYVTSFATRICWDGRDKSVSKQKSEKSPMLKLDSNITAEERVRAFLPTKLVQRTALVDLELFEGEVPSDSRCGYLVQGGKTKTVACFTEIAGSAWARLLRNPAVITCVGVSRTGSGLSKNELLGELLSVAFPDKSQILLPGAENSSGFVILLDGAVAFEDLYQEMGYTVFYLTDNADLERSLRTITEGVK